MVSEVKFVDFNLRDKESVKMGHPAKGGSGCGSLSIRVFPKRWAIARVRLSLVAYSLQS